MPLLGGRGVITEMTHIYILSFAFNRCFIVMVTTATETKTEACLTFLNLENHAVGGGEHTRVAHWRGIVTHVQAYRVSKQLLLCIENISAETDPISFWLLKWIYIENILFCLPLTWFTLNFRYKRFKQFTRECDFWGGEGVGGEKNVFCACVFLLLFLVINSVALLYVLTWNQLSFPPDVYSFKKNPINMSGFSWLYTEFLKTYSRRECMRGKICKGSQKQEEELLVVVFGI